MAQADKDALDSAMKRLDSLQNCLNGILAENVGTNTILAEVVKPKLELVDRHERLFQRAWGWGIGISMGCGALGARVAKAMGMLGEVNR